MSADHRCFCQNRGTYEIRRAKQERMKASKAVELPLYYLSSLTLSSAALPSHYDQDRAQRIISKPDVISEQAAGSYPTVR